MRKTRLAVGGRGVAAGFVAAALLLAGPGRAAVEVSPDTHLAIGGEVLGPNESGEDDLAGTVTFTGVDLPLPDGVHLDALTRYPEGDALFSTDVSVDLGRGLVLGPADLLRVPIADPPVVVFSGSAAGVPAGANLDAVALEPGGDLLISFDVTVSLGGQTYDDEDLIRIEQPAGTPSPAFDGSAEGVPAPLDLDAVSVLDDGRLALSFDITGVVDGIPVDDEDLIAWDPATGTFAPYYDGSVQYAAWQPSDLEAAHVPGDRDGDGIRDDLDNCIFVFNPDQADVNAAEDDDSSRNGTQHYGDACDVDLDNDGTVGTSDFFGVFRPCLGEDPTQNPACAPADLDGDGIIGTADFFARLRPALGSTPGPGITEP